MKPRPRRMSRSDQSVQSIILCLTAAAAAWGIATFVSLILSQ